MGSFCSKPRFLSVTQPQKIFNFKSSDEFTFSDQFYVEKADHNFILSAYGTSEPNKWNIERLSREFRCSIKPYDRVLKPHDPELSIRLTPVLNPDGSIYYGQWKNDRYDGIGHLFLADGSQYIGSFSNGSFEGSGEMLFVNGDKFRGMFLSGKRHGKGILHFRNGDVYDGSWSYGARHGYGVERFSDGTVYMGNFKVNKRSGHGELRKPDGTHYEGNFVNNTITGVGKMQWPNGETYTGSFKNGLKHGNGTTTWKHGEYISQKGYYHDGMKSGNFKMIKRDGTVKEAVYHKDQPVRSVDDPDDAKFGHSSRFSSKSSYPPSRSSTKFSPAESFSKNFSAENEHAPVTHEALEYQNDFKRSPRITNVSLANNFSADNSDKSSFERSLSKDSFEPANGLKISREGSHENLSNSEMTNGYDRKDSFDSKRPPFGRPPPKEFPNRPPHPSSGPKFKKPSYFDSVGSRDSQDFGSQSPERTEQPAVPASSNSHAPPEPEKKEDADHSEPYTPFTRGRFPPRGRVGRFGRGFRGRRGSSRFTT